MKKIILLITTCLLAFNINAQFNLLDKAKDKVNNKANQKVDQTMDKGLDDATSGNKGAKKKDDKPAKDTAAAATSSNKTTTNAAPTEASGAIKAYNNYDFVPGENILFEDHFTDTQDGEFPSHWDLISGQGVVNKAAGKSAFLLTEGNYVKVKPVMKTENYLTDPFTAEFDFYAGRGTYNVQLFFKSSGDEGKYIAFGPEVNTGGGFSHDLSATYPGNHEEYYNKWHHAAFIYKNGQMKCYVDQYRVLVIPKCDFVPEAIEFGGIGSLEGPLTFTNVKIAAGGAMNMLDKIMTDGKFVTHAITFDVNKSTIKPESMGFLNQMAKYMKDNPTLKLEVDGHTDSDGADDLNMTLSQSRADAVKAQLVSMGIEDSRLSAKGFGKTKPMSDNNTVEGKANNRRVEFVKI